MDPKTSIKNHSRSCGRNRSNCIYSTIARLGDLIAHRVEADSRGELNLASLGVYQKPKNPPASKKMEYIQIEFRTHNERLRFEAEFRVTQKIYQKKHSLHYADRRNEKQHDSVSLFFCLSCLKSIYTPLGMIDLEAST